jgi:hypothetical protein
VHSVRRQGSSSKPPDEGGKSLPLRWALIISIAAGVGFAVAGASGSTEAFTVGFGVVGLLHVILP